MEGLFSALAARVDELCLRPFDAFSKWHTMVQNGNPDTPWLQRFREVLETNPTVQELGWSELEWSEALKALDADNDGVVSFKEFKLMFSEYRPPREKQPQDQVMTAVQHEKAAQQRDLVWTVLKAVCDWLDTQQNSRASEVFRGWVNQLDKDRNGSLDATEFAQGVRQIVPALHQLPESRLQAVFRAVDATSVRRVKFKDFSAAPQKHGRVHAKKLRVVVAGPQKFPNLATLIL
eukprot:TRINITY_DN50373_c0_g2_i1.p2 TRINITY_DN50373_c0_g2~~TRINITY_DN50373_c0_g2_i1.p2  ORF type:complete len:234 (-),score=50.25 TRINITY_DN50373_c0_g2_i1:61-762(-)